DGLLKLSETVQLTLNLSKLIHRKRSSGYLAEVIEREILWSPGLWLLGGRHEVGSSSSSNSYRRRGGLICCLLVGHRQRSSVQYYCSWHRGGSPHVSCSSD